MTKDHNTYSADENEMQHQVHEDVVEAAYGIQSPSLLYAQVHAAAQHADGWGKHTSVFVTSKMNNLASAWKAAGYNPSPEDVQMAIAVFEGEEDEANGLVLSENEMDDFFDRFAV